MTIEIEIDGRRRQVALRREDDRWVAELDGRDITVSIVEAGGRWSMLVNPAEAGLHDGNPAEAGDDTRHVEFGSGRTSNRAVGSGFSRTSYDVAVEALANGELVVHVNGVAMPVAIVDRRRRGRTSGGDAGTDSQPRAVVAPMPGRIVKVLVKPGEAVQARQGLVVVEAMKMENELRAPRSGTVAEVRIREGASVEANAVLVVLR